MLYVLIKLEYELLVYSCWNSDSDITKQVKQLVCNYIIDIYLIIFLKIFIGFKTYTYCFNTYLYFESGL